MPSSRSRGDRSSERSLPGANASRTTARGESPRPPGHGLFGQGKNIQAIARALEPQFRSLLVDLPNHGASGSTERVDYAEMADAVAARLRDELVDEGGAQPGGPDPTAPCRAVRR